MERVISGFEWDHANLAHCQKHGVSRAEAESVFTRPVVILPDVANSRTERRFRAIGTTVSGRAVFVVFTIRRRQSDSYLRLISARFMHRREIDRYEKDNPFL